VRLSVHKSFSNFDLIWCVGSPRPDMRTNVTSTRSKVKIKVTELLKFKNCTFLDLSRPPFLCSSKLMVDYNDIGPSLQLIGAWFLNFLSKLSCDFKLRGMSILQDFERAIFLCCLRLESHGRECWCMLIWPWANTRSRSCGDEHQSPSGSFFIARCLLTWLIKYNLV